MTITEHITEPITEPTTEPIVRIIKRAVNVGLFGLIKRAGANAIANFLTTHSESRMVPLLNAFVLKVKYGIKMR